MKLKLGESKFGKALFSSEPIRVGAEILDYEGPKVSYEELPTPYDAVEDHYIQIGPRLYLGPSGKLDDFVNHSCDPNAGLKFLDARIVLVCIRPILKGEEITLDYSTTMDEDEWEIPCECGAKACRGRIRDFKKLPIDIQERYVALGVVPPFISDRYFAR